MLFRALFLKTIKPQSAFEKLLSKWGVILGTKLVDSIEMYFCEGQTEQKVFCSFFLFFLFNARFIGYDNVVFFATMAAIAFTLKSYMFFLVTTSFVHYCQFVAAGVRRAACSPCACVAPAGTWACTTAATVSATAPLCAMRWCLSSPPSATCFSCQ